MAPKTLHVFDFDGTLFKSPLPNPKHLSRYELGRLQSDGGWFHLAPSLDPPAVPEEVGGEWWIEEVREAAEKAIGDENATAILLTGRGEKVFRGRVEGLLKCAGLVFDSVNLKPPGATTFDFKTSVISKYINAGHTEVIVYEDRIRHVTRFRDFLSRQDALAQHEVVHIDKPNEDFYLPHPVQEEVVESMKTLAPDYFAVRSKKSNEGGKGKGKGKKGKGQGKKGKSPEANDLVEALEKLDVR